MTKTTTIQLRVSPARKARWQHLAAADNRTLSNWIAHTIDHATAETPDTIEDAGAQAETPHVALQPPRPEAPPDTPSTSSTRPELPPPSHDPITADLTAHLDHTSDEFKTIIQEHYRQTPSLRKIADIHGVSRSTVHRIVQAQ